MRRLKPFEPLPRLPAPAAISALFCLVASTVACGEENELARPAVPEVSPRYLESPFRLDDADAQGLPAYLRLPSKPPLFYPQAVDLFSWIDAANQNAHSLQDLIEQPDLADQIFPKRSSFEANSELLSVFDSLPVKPPEPDDPAPKDAVDLFVARISEEASLPGDENALKEHMRVHPPSEEVLLKGIAYLESLRKGGEAAPAPPLPSTPSPLAPFSSVEPIEGTSPFGISPPVSPPVAVPLPPPSVSVTEIAAPVSPPAVSEAVLPTEATLRMAAKVPMPDGSQRPAFASQFFLTTRQLEDLLTEAIPYPSAANDVRQLIRLWAESEKRAGSKGVKLALNVKSVLIKAQVSKFDTDLKGEARVAGLKPDDYYLIGIDKDDQTGIVTIWSKAIAIGRGENRVDLSLQDIVWNK